MHANCRNTILTVIILLSMAGCAAKSPSYIDIGDKPGLYENPAWSPDGKQIVFLFTPSDKGSEQMVRLDVDENHGWQEIKTLADSALSGTNPEWLNQDTIVYVRSDVNPQTLVTFSELVFYDLTHNTEVLHSPGGVITRISVNQLNQQIALVRETRKDHFSLMIYDLAGNNSYLVYDPPDDSRLDGASWDLKGNQLAFTVAARSPNVLQERPASLGVIDPSTKVQKTIWESSTQVADSPTWSSSGQWLAVRIVDKAAGYQSAILLISSDGIYTKKVDLGTSVTPVDISWSPVGNKLLFTSLGQPGRNSLYVLDISQWLNN